jgi:hypothetical protein
VIGVREPVLQAVRCSRHRSAQPGRKEGIGVVGNGELGLFTGKGRPGGHRRPGPRNGASSLPHGAG